MGVWLFPVPKAALHRPDATHADATHGGKKGASVKKESQASSEVTALAFEDDGPGMPEERIDALREKFEAAERKVSTDCTAIKQADARLGDLHVLPDGASPKTKVGGYVAQHGPLLLTSITKCTERGANIGSLNPARLREIYTRWEGAADLSPKDKASLRSQFEASLGNYGSDAPHGARAGDEFDDIVASPKPSSAARVPGPKSSGALALTQELLRAAKSGPQAKENVTSLLRTTSEAQSPAPFLERLAKQIMTLSTKFDPTNPTDVANATGVLKTIIGTSVGLLEKELQRSKGTTTESFYQRQLDATNRLAGILKSKGLDELASK